MKKLIQPATRGSITKAITESQLSKIAPESPRPLEMLDSVEITSSDILTADDAALHELLVSAAYEADKGMTAEFTSLPVATALKFLGTHARRDALKVSMRRLMATTVSYGTKKSRRFEDVPLIFSYLETNESEDVIRYSLPEPIRILMRSMPAYAYLELAPLSQMKSKYSVRLYRIFAAAAARQKWTPDGENKVVVSASLEDLYRWTGFPLDTGKMNFGKFRQRVLNKLVYELATVRRFNISVEEIRKEARGRPLERVDFHVILRAPSHHLTRVSFNKRTHRLLGVGGVDAPEFRVNSYVWQRVQRAFSGFSQDMNISYFGAWQIALKEALDADPITPEYDIRYYRGKRLLNVIKLYGPDEAAFQFCAEEVQAPDLLSNEVKSLFWEEAAIASEARKKRIVPKPPKKEKLSSQARGQDLSKTEVASTVPTSNEDEGTTSSVGMQLFEELLAEEDQKFERAEPTQPSEPTPELEPETSANYDPAIDDITTKLLTELLEDEAPEETDAMPDLSNIREIIWTADHELSYEEVDERVFPVIQNIIYTGEHKIELTVRCWIDGLVEEFTFGQRDVSPEDIAYITDTLAADRLLDDDISEPDFITYKEIS